MQPRGKPRLFDTAAEQYDLWFESPDGKAIFEIEKNSLLLLLLSERDRWLEVGVGSGRFSASFGISEGIDPSSGMLAIAAQRRIHLVRGIAEDLPYRDAIFHGILMVTTLCFLRDPKRALAEFYRILGFRGTLVVGMIPAEGAWGQLYITKGRKGHSLYSEAHFYTCREVVRLCADVGFAFEKAVSCLLTAPGNEPSPLLEEGMKENAGFVAMRFHKT
jgi:ubiquinone/menaquinone biosynthesis C-methylase UbiE